MNFRAPLCGVAMLSLVSSFNAYTQELPSFPNLGDCDQLGEKYRWKPLMEDAKATLRNEPFSTATQKSLSEFSVWKNKPETDCGVAVGINPAIQFQCVVDKVPREESYRDLEVHLLQVLESTLCRSRKSMIRQAVSECWNQKLKDALNTYNSYENFFENEMAADREKILKDEQDAARRERDLAAYSLRLKRGQAPLEVLKKLSAELLELLYRRSYTPSLLNAIEEKINFFRQKERELSGVFEISPDLTDSQLGHPCQAKAEPRDRYYCLRARYKLIDRRALGNHDTQNLKMKLPVTFGGVDSVHVMSLEHAHIYLTSLLESIRKQVSEFSFLKKRHIEEYLAKANGLIGKMGALRQWMKYLKARFKESGEADEPEARSCTQILSDSANPDRFKFRTLGPCLFGDDWFDFNETKVTSWLSRLRLASEEEAKLYQDALDALKGTSGLLVDCENQLKDQFRQEYSELEELLTSFISKDCVTTLECPPFSEAAGRLRKNRNVLDLLSVNPFPNIDCKPIPPPPSKPEPLLPIYESYLADGQNRFRAHVERYQCRSDLLFCGEAERKRFETPVEVKVKAVVDLLKNSDLTKANAQFAGWIGIKKAMEVCEKPGLRKSHFLRLLTETDVNDMSGQDQKVPIRRDRTRKLENKKAQKAERFLSVCGKSGVCCDLQSELQRFFAGASSAAEAAALAAQEAASLETALALKTTQCAETTQVFREKSAELPVEVDRFLGINKLDGAIGE